MKFGGLHHVFTRRRIMPLGFTAVVVFLFTKWRESSYAGGQQPAEPFCIAGNFYYVGANDVSVFLITGPKGHVLIDGGYPGTAPMIMASIAKPDFDIRDVKVLLNSDPHRDHAGGLAALQQASGAELWASEASAYSIASGGDDPVSPFIEPKGYYAYIGSAEARYRWEVLQ